MAGIEVHHERGDRFRIDIRSHSIVVDQPIDAGGEDTGPTPTELFVAGLASCVAFYARRFMRRHDISSEGLAVEGDYVMSEDRPARVASIGLRVVLPKAFPEARIKAFHNVVSHCTVHNSIVHAPEMTINTVVRQGEPSRP